MLSPKTRHLGYLSKLCIDAELLMRNPENFGEICAEKKVIEDVLGRCMQSYKEYYQLALEPETKAEALNDYYSVMISRKEFDERLKEWLQTVERSPDEMLVSSRKRENINVVDHHVTLSPTDSKSTKSKSSKASSRTSERSRKARAKLLRWEVSLHF